MSPASKLKQKSAKMVFHKKFQSSKNRVKSYSFLWNVVRCLITTQIEKKDNIVGDAPTPHGLIEFSWKIDLN